MVASTEVVGFWESGRRAEVVTKVRAYIREHGLQDSANKQAILADDRLRAVFGRDRATVFEMQGLLSPHLTAA